MNNAWRLVLLCLVFANITAAQMDTPKEWQRTKRQLSYAIPVYYDTAAQQQPQQQPGFLPNLPIIGTLVGNIPGLGSQQNGLLGGGLNGLLGSLGLAGQNVPANGGANTATCPLSQKLTCRCESLLPIKPPGTRSAPTLDILAQNSNQNADGSQELIAELSNDLIIYQKTSKQPTLDPTADANAMAQQSTTEGYFSLKLAETKYLTIRYNVSDVDYTVTADVSAGPPVSG